jgi:hypothetical protein
MNPKQAKDFLVQQVKEQARLDGISLSDLEARMMYFTESDDSCENPLELHEEFEAKYDTAEYETKISRFLHHALGRLKDEDPEKSRIWNLAIRTLRKGDHYLLVLWDVAPTSDHPMLDFFKPIGIGVLIAIGVFIAMVVSMELNISWDRFRGYFPAPHLRLAVILVGVWVVALGGPRIFNWLRAAWNSRREGQHKRLE